MDPDDGSLCWSLPISLTTATRKKKKNLGPESVREVQFREGSSQPRQKRQKKKKKGSNKGGTLKKKERKNVTRGQQQPSSHRLRINRREKKSQRHKHKRAL